MNKNTVFSSAEIILPAVKEPEKWPVIACDQFTSDPEYWDQCEKTVEGSPSSYDFILPEAYLGSEKEIEKKEKIARAMERVNDYPTETVDGFIALKRTLPEKAVRYGLVGKIDLEHYDFSPESKSLVRATEKTVISRIPPRVRIRAEATVELPHILVFTRPGCGFIKKAFSLVGKKKPIYDLELMQGGGHITGFSVTGKDCKTLSAEISSYEKGSGDILYAVGDGNHSLAAAKSFYEELKTKIGREALDHPARYALCEMVDIDDPSIVFEPIFRVMTDCSPSDVLDKLAAVCGDGGEQSFTAVTSEGEYRFSFAEPDHALTVGTLQNFIDGYIEENPSVKCDYIHGTEELRCLAERKGSIGFLFDGVEKNDLFDYISKNGTYPRKTFSMGEARSKRYYYEMRSIIPG